MTGVARVPRCPLASPQLLPVPAQQWAARRHRHLTAQLRRRQDAAAREKPPAPRPRQVRLAHRAEGGLQVSQLLPRVDLTNYPVMDEACMRCSKLEEFHGLAPRLTSRRLHRKKVLAYCSSATGAAKLEEINTAFVEVIIKQKVLAKTTGGKF